MNLPRTKMNLLRGGGGRVRNLHAAPSRRIGSQCLCRSNNEDRSMYLPCFLEGTGSKRLFETKNPNLSGVK